MWRISQIRGPRNRELPEQVHEQVVGMLQQTIEASRPTEGEREPSKEADDPDAAGANVDFARSA